MAKRKPCYDCKHCRFVCILVSRGSPNKYDEMEVCVRRNMFELIPKHVKQCDAKELRSSQMIQTILDFSRPKARKGDPSSSHLAAKKVEGKAQRVLRLCIAEVRRKPGQTAAEIAKVLGMDRHDPSRRLPGARDAGKVLNWHWNSEENPCTMIPSIGVNRCIYWMEWRCALDRRNSLDPGTIELECKYWKFRCKAVRKEARERYSRRCNVTGSKSMTWWPSAS